MVWLEKGLCQGAIRRTGVPIRRSCPCSAASPEILVLRLREYSIMKPPSAFWFYPPVQAMFIPDLQDVRGVQRWLLGLAGNPPQLAFYLYHVLRHRSPCPFAVVGDDLSRIADAPLRIARSHQDCGSWPAGWRAAVDLPAAPPMVTGHSRSPGRTIGGSVRHTRLRSPAERLQIPVARSSSRMA